MDYSWLLCILGVSWVLAAGKGYRWAWYLGLFAEMVWMWYGIVTHQYGFVFGAAIYSVAHTRNIYVTRKAAAYEQTPVARD